jgi:hypothetical protein
MLRPEDILARMQEHPFRPVRIIVSEGLRHDIYHPDLVLVGQRDLIIGFPASENASLYDRTVRVALIHVVALEDIPITGATTNGPV